MEINQNTTKIAVTTEQKKKKKLKIVSVQQPKKYYLPDDVFNIVKEFVGVYKISANWKKLERLSLEKLHSFYKYQMRCRVKRFRLCTNKNRCLNYLENRDIIRKRILKRAFATPTNKFNNLQVLSLLTNPKK